MYIIFHRKTFNLYLEQNRLKKFHQMEQTSLQNSVFRESFICPLCKISIQFAAEHLKHFHKITEKNVVEKLLSSEEFSPLKNCANDFDIKPVISVRPPNKPERSKQVQDSLIRFLCKQCQFVNKHESEMAKHFEKKHTKMGRPAGKKEGRWRKQRMKVCLTRIDQV
jgi:hypothetical protein